jgi:two-component system, sporulation sensor kinase E
LSKESECIVRWDKEYSKIFETLFENTFIPCALLDSSFNFISVNKAYAEIDNRKPSDFVGKNHFELYPSDAEKIFREVVVTKKPYQVYARPFIYALNPERGITYWDWSLTPVINEWQEVEFLVLTLYDVTQRVKALEELDNFFNLSVDLLGIMDFHGRLIKVNGYFEKILGYGKGELKDTLLFNLIHAEDRSEMEHVFYKSLESGEPVVNIENRCRHKSKDYKDIQWVIVPNKNNRICYVVGHDITENKKIQAELNRLESLSLLGTITAEINHELRNPLATVRVFYSLCLKKKTAKNIRTIWN